MSEENPTFFQVHFVYKDGKDLSINMAHEQLAEFFEELNAKKIFWYGSGNGKEEELDMGFWTNVDEVRFIQIKEIKGVPYVEQPPVPATLEAVEKESEVASK